MRKRLTSASLLAAFFMAGLGSDRLVIHYHHPLKHTWDCQLVSHNTEHTFWFVRPNKELFEVYFDNPPILQVGMSFKDIAYTDDNADLRHFVKATLK